MLASHDSAVVDGIRLETASPFPALVRPAHPDVDLAGLVAAGHPFFDQLLADSGAVLFRGFSLRTVTDFERAAGALCPQLHRDYGDLPLHPEGGQIYQATPYPAEKPIHFHNEASHTRLWPRRQMFFCLEPAASGGETLIADGQQTYRQLAPELRNRFERLGLLYHRNFVAGFDIRWQDFYRTDDPSELWELCRRQGIALEWTPSGPRTQCPAPAVISHPRTGEPIWFNQLQLHHPACLDARARNLLLRMFSEECDFPRYVSYGDRSPIAGDTMAAISHVLSSVATAVTWQAGDLLLLDNLRVAHARRPFEGNRRIAVALGDMIGADAFTRTA